MNQLLNTEAMKRFASGNYCVEKGCEALIINAKHVESAMPGEKCVKKDGDDIRVLFTNRELSCTAGAGNVFTGWGKAASGYAVFRFRVLSALRIAMKLPAILDKETDAAKLISQMTRPVIQEAIIETLDEQTPNKETFTRIIREALEQRLSDCGLFLMAVDKTGFDNGGRRI